MVSGAITKDGLSISKVYQCEICHMMAKANSVLCVQCCNCIHSRCVYIKRVNQIYQKISFAGNAK